MHPHDEPDWMRRFEAACRERGLPVTVQRRVLLDALVRTDAHPTADELWESARERIPGLSRTTVYRVLETLVGLGLARRLPHPRGAARFDGDVSPHHHAVCVLCDRVYDVSEPAGASLPRPKGLPAGYRLEGCTILYVGRCRECQTRGN